jgi:hypothetical protein
MDIGNCLIVIFVLQTFTPCLPMVKKWFKNATATSTEEGGSDSVYSFFDVSGFKAGFGRKLFTDIDIRLVVNSDIQLKNARLSPPNRNHNKI